MPGSAVKERLAQDIALWQADGLISQETGHLLRQRYDTPGFGLTTLVKYIGLSGGFLAAMGVLGLIGALTASLAVGGGMALAVSTGLFVGGLSLARDPQARYQHSCKVVLALAVIGLASGVAALVKVADGDVVLLTGLGTLPVVGIMAYRFKNTFLLIAGLIGLFHWIGSWAAMAGRSTYETSFEEPRVIAAAALLVIGIGVFHERSLRATTLRFYQAYEAVGLAHLNLALLILSIDGHGHDFEYVLVFTGVALAQIVAGARLKNPLFLGFGVTAAGIDLMTRYYEHFWSDTRKGLFLLAGGAVLFFFGAALEMFARAWMPGDLAEGAR